MEQMGWIQLHRKFIDWEWYDDINTKVLFIHCLLKANHVDKKWRGVDINRGEFLTSYSNLSIETGLSVQKIRTSISNLESTGEVTRQSTSKLTKLTICKYDTYNNLKSSANKQGNTQITNEQQTNNKPITTTKNDNNKKNEKKVSRFAPPRQEDVSSYCLERNNGVDSVKWYNFYSAKDWMIGKNKMKDWKAAVRTWEENKTTAKKSTFDPSTWTGR